MANRAEMIRGVAELLKRTEISVQCQDRVLATSGVRANAARGRGGPPVSSAAITQLVTALLSNRTFSGGAEFARTWGDLILVDCSVERGDLRVIEPTGTGAPRRFGVEFAALIETAPDLPELLDMEVRISCTRPDAVIRVEEMGEVRTLTFRRGPYPEPDPAYEEFATLPAGALSRLVAIRHGAFEMPFRRVPDPESGTDLVGPEGFEPPT